MYLSVYSNYSSSLLDNCSVRDNILPHRRSRPLNYSAEMRNRKWRAFRRTTDQSMDVPGKDVICARRFRRMEKREVSMQITRGGREGAKGGSVRRNCDV